MKKVRIDAVGLFVKDIKTMVEFYRDVVGFEIDWDGGPFAEFMGNADLFVQYLCD